MPYKAIKKYKSGTFLCKEFPSIQQKALKFKNVVRTNVHKLNGKPFYSWRKTKKTRHGKGFQWRMRTVIYSVLLKAKMNLSFTILLNYQKLMGKVEFGFQLLNQTLSKPLKFYH